MYNNRSPIRTTTVSRSVSPVSQVKIVGNVHPPPPGMKTVLKPTVYRAIEVPLSQYASLPQVIPPQLESELHRQIRSLEQEVQQYRTQLTHREESSELVKRLQEEIRSLHMEVDRSRADPNAKYVQEQCEKYFSMFQQCELEKNELAHTVSFYEQKMRKLQQQAEQDSRLHHEVELWKQKYHQSETDNQRQIDMLKDEFDKIYNDHFSNLKQNAEMKCQALEEQLRKIQFELDDATKDTEMWRQRTHQEELDKMTLIQKINELELVGIHQAKDVERLNLQVISKQQEIDQYKQRINFLEFNYQTVNSQGFESEIRRLKESLDARQKEIDDLKRRNHEVEQTVLRMKEAQVELDLLRQKHLLYEGQISEQEKYKHLSNALQMEIDEHKQRYLRLDGMMSEMKRNEYRLASEAQRLNDLLRLKDEELGKLQADYKKSMQSLQGQIAHFKTMYEKDIVYQNHWESSKPDHEAEIQHLQQEADSLRREREGMQQACAQLSQTKLQLENKILIMTGEIDRLNLLMKNKSDEIKNMRETNQSLEEQIEQMRSQNDLFRRELELYKTRSNSKIMNSGSQKKFDFISHQHQDSNWN